VVDADAVVPLPMLECTDIRMSFGGVPVLRGVSLSLHEGTVTALAGENGAGKSTLMKIASGQYRADGGEVRVRAEPVPAGNARAAHELGVAIVPQELASIPEMLVYENLFIGRELRTRMGLLHRARMIAVAQEQLAEFGVEIDPRARMGSLAVGTRQIIEIVKATTHGAKVLLLDEPTSAIAEREVARLAGVVRSLRDQGVAVLFTTHKMEEIRAMADRVVVLRDGGLVADERVIDVSDDDIVTAMIGRELTSFFPARPEPGDEVMLEVSNLRIDAVSDPMSFTVRRGEILGLAGLVGAGRTELLESLFGIRNVLTGEVRVAGRLVPSGRPGAAIRQHMAIVPEDRKGSGAVLSMSILDNVTLPRLDLFSRAGLLRGRYRRAASESVMSSVRLKSSGPNQLLENLSGGNQQKVVLGRWLTADVDVFLLDEPTRGVDVGARSEIYRIITELAGAGMAVVMASSDMPEILALSHRALVLRENSVVGEIDRAELDAPGIQDTIFRMASGQHVPRTEETE
jgi:ribose transport system ATP-binding protein